MEDHFKQTLAAQKAIDEVREERFQVELERERQRAEVYKGIIKRRLALEEKREARPQGLWELEKERLGLNAGRTGSEKLELLYILSLTLFSSATQQCRCVRSQTMFMYR